MKVLHGMVLVAVVGMLLPGCSGKAASPLNEGVSPSPTLPVGILDGPGEPGTLEPARCRFALPEDLKEGLDVDCAYLSVPEVRASDGSAADGRMIMLAVAVFHPPGGAKHPDPVIYLSGGPGFSALKVVRYGLDAFTEPIFAAERELVLFDQRGVGLSRPALDCPAFQNLAWELLDRRVDGRVVTDDEVSELSWEASLQCRESLAELADLSAYNSVTSADDVEELRKALAADQINLWGGSYGTRLALEIMRRHPAGLRSVVLDAVYPPDVDLYVEAPGNYARALDRLFEACAENPVCDAAHPNLREVFFKTVEHLNAAPALREAEDLITGETQEIWMNGDTLLALTFQLLYDSRLRYLLPEQITRANKGDYSAFDLAQASSLRLTSLSSRGMTYSVQCHEEIAFSSIEEFHIALASHPEIAPMYENGLLGGLSYRVCPEWGAGRAEASANEPVASEIPTLVMSGEFDPVTPPDWARRAAETLSNSYFYEYPGLGHGAAGAAECPDQMMIEFLQNPLSAPLDACIAGMR